ncbi:unnamed protein product [Hydatigera taeniaeformis]|uniref:Uncharacterized protein n=1 Tax=Hydatigena taeniaeformis TaxID=6205 RepID=A0A3P7F729_HYDTA|nr:unnamed protein product [Hydatigera taeniaeformis]
MTNEFTSILSPVECIIRFQIGLIFRGCSHNCIHMISYLHDEVCNLGRLHHLIGKSHSIFNSFGDSSTLI